MGVRSKPWALQATNSELGCLSKDALIEVVCDLVSRMNGLDDAEVSREWLLEVCNPVLRERGDALLRVCPSCGNLINKRCRRATCVNRRN